MDQADRLSFRADEERPRHLPAPHIKDRGGIRTRSTTSSTAHQPFLEAVGVPMPTVLNGAPQRPIEGVSMMYSFHRRESTVDAPDPVLRDVRQSRHLQRRWIASTTPLYLPWSNVPRGGRHWPLTNTNGSFTGSPTTSPRPSTLPAMNRGSCADAGPLWEEAARHNVLPLDNSRCGPPGRAHSARA
jgi:arylsulfatase